jgi:hypothetical protein
MIHIIQIEIEFIISPIEIKTNINILIEEYGTTKIKIIDPLTMIITTIDLLTMKVKIIRQLIMIIKIELDMIKVQQFKILIGNYIDGSKTEDKEILIPKYKQGEE